MLLVACVPVSVCLLPQLALDEESVWRAVLAWAKHGANVSRPTAQWSEDERARVCAQMSGVINHVKLLLIGEADRRAV